MARTRSPDETDRRTEAESAPPQRTRRVREAPLPAAGIKGFETLFAGLNALLARAVERQAQVLGPASLLDPWRGMHLDVEDVRAALAATPGAPLDAGCGAADLLGALARTDPRLARAGALLELTPLELAVVAIVLAPELDLRYERIYAYLQDDITRKRPALDLVARLLCDGVQARLALLRRFAPGAPLIRARLVEWHGAPEAPLLARPLGIDPLWRNFLLDRDQLDPLLGACARLVDNGGDGLDAMPLDEPLRSMLRGLRDAARAGRASVRLALAGPHGTGKAALSRALAHDLRRRLLVVDLREVAGAGDLSTIIERAHWAGLLYDALPCLHGVGRLGQRDPQLLRRLVEALTPADLRFVLWLTEPLPQLHTEPLQALRLDVALPSAGARAAAWHRALRHNGVRADEGATARIAAHFRLSGAQIAQAAADAAPAAAARADRSVSGDELAACARALCGDELARLAQRIRPEAGFEALVTTPEVAAQLREIAQRVGTREAVRRDWTRGSVHARHAGVTALFAGPSGTGKTLAAEGVALELGYDLFRIDLSAVVSKYIGETEKNLERVFAAAVNANAVLLFDEADALFGKRSEVKDAHDRYANIEIAYLLQKMEQFDGLAILATNLKQNLDEAFARRLTFTVNFAFPEAGERERLWEVLWPPLAPRTDDVDLAWFAREYPLSGGNIRNTVLAAIHLAAADGRVVTREHLLHAIRREYQKLGKNLGPPARVPERRVS